MAITRSRPVFLGTDETTGVTIANNATASSSAAVDLLGDDVSTGWLHLYLCVTSTVTAGSIDVRFNSLRVPGTAYKARSYQFSVSPSNGTQPIFLGTVQVGRYATVDVFNNATGANATNVAVLGELAKVS